MHLASRMPQRQIEIESYPFYAIASNACVTAQLET